MRFVFPLPGPLELENSSEDVKMDSVTQKLTPKSRKTFEMLFTFHSFSPPFCSDYVGALWRRIVCSSSTLS